MIVSRDLLNYSGRFDFTNEIEPECAWPNSSISINFEGDKLSANLESDGCDYFLVVLDGRIHINCLPVKGRKVYILVQDIEYKLDHINQFIYDCYYEYKNKHVKVLKRK